MYIYLTINLNKSKFNLIVVINTFFFFKKIRELIEKNIPEEEASKLVMLYAIKSISKDSNKELTSLIQLLKSKKVAEHWIEVITKI